MLLPRRCVRGPDLESSIRRPSRESPPRKAATIRGYPLSPVLSRRRGLPRQRQSFCNNDNAAIGLRVEWNFFEGGKTRAATGNCSTAKVLEERQQELKQQIRIQVEDAYEQLKVAKADMEASEVALKQAEENERMTSIQYREQLVIFLEVLNARSFFPSHGSTTTRPCTGMPGSCGSGESRGRPIQAQGKKKS